MVTLDTNVIIYYLKREAAVVSVLEPIFSDSYSVYPPCIASVTELELFSSPTLTLADIAEIERLLKLVIVIPLDSSVARIAGRIRREWRLKTPDSIIAATALSTHSSLVTRNTRDFKKVSGLEVKGI